MMMIGAETSVILIVNARTVGAGPELGRAKKFL